jgi:hypothetical protein
MVVKLSDFLTTSLVLSALDSGDVLSIVRSNTIGIDSNTTGDFVANITGGTGIDATGTGHAAAVTLSVDNTVVTTDSSQTLINKTFNLTNNTFSGTLNQLNAAISGATLVSLDGAETLTNKTLTSPTINGGSFTSGSVVDISTFGLRDATTTAYETRIRSNNASPALSADRTLTLDVNNANRTISLTGNLVLGGTLTTSGAHNTTFTTSGTTSLTLPTTGTLVSSTDFSTRFDNDLATKTTTNVAEGTNLYYTQARFDSAFGDKTTSNLTEGTNLYYTQGRFDTAFAAKSTTNLSEGTNLYYTTARSDSDFDVRLATKTTTNVAEGTNLYYTTARHNSDFDTRLATKSTTNLSEGTNLYYTTARANSDFDTRLATKSTTNVTEGTNLYYTTARANSDFDARLATKSTTNLSEGTNLYYTPSRADSDARNAISVTDNGGDGSLTYTASTGVISYTGPSAAEVRAHFSGGTGITYNSGTGEITTTDGDIVHDNLSGFVANEHINHSGVVLTAGDGLTGGGNITTSRTFNVGAGVGVKVAANSVSIDSAEISNYNLPIRALFSASGNLSYNSTTGAFSFSETYSTAAELLTAIKTVDGTTSGLDADLLDGQEGSHYRIDVYDASGTLLN